MALRRSTPAHITGNTPVAIALSAFLVAVCSYAPASQAAAQKRPQPAKSPGEETSVRALFAYAQKKVRLIHDDPSTWDERRKACAAMIPGPIPGDGSMNGFTPWSSHSAWRQDISDAPVDPRSQQWIRAMSGAERIGLRGPIPTTASDNWGEARSGMPFHIVGNSTRRMHVSQDLAKVSEIAAIDPEAYPGQSDPGPFPVPWPPLIQGTIKQGRTNYVVGGDKHLILLDKDLCFEHEMWNTYVVGDRLYAGTIATFDMLGEDNQRPWGWSSSSVSGAPQFAGIISAEDVLRGRVHHAGAFTALGKWGRAAFIPPAAHHQWNNKNDPAMPPFGARLRLRKDFDISKYGRQSQVLLQALKSYGTIYVDGGMPVDNYFSMDSRWDWPDLGDGYWQVKVNPTDFEFIDAGQIYSFVGDGPRPPDGPPPVIHSLEVYPRKVRAGQPAIVFWRVVGESMRFLSTVGATRKNYAIVYPTEITEYVLTAQNRNGRVTRAVSVKVY